MTDQQQQHPVILKEHVNKTTTDVTCNCTDDDYMSSKEWCQGFVQV